MPAFIHLEYDCDMIKKITSSANQTVRLIKKLKDKKYRDAENAYLIEGPNLLSDAIRNKEDIIAVVISSEFQEKENSEEITEISGFNIEEVAQIVLSVTPEIFKSLSDTLTPQGIVAVVKKRQSPLLKNIDEQSSCHNNNRYIILDELQDPGNVGTIIRTAEAAGFTGIIAVKGTADIYSSKVIRAAAGSLFRIDILESENREETLKFAKDNEIKLYACDGNAEQEYTDIDLTDSIGLVIGNEGNGVSDFFMSQCEKIKIPMSEATESLNASVAAGIIIYESVRQRKKDQ